MDLKLWNSYWKSKKTKISINKKRMLKVIKKYLSKGIVLDAGCGSGFFSKYFIDSGYKVISLDYSEVALKLTKSLNQKIITVQGDVFRLPFSQNIFDLVFSDGLLEHYKNPLPILKEFKRVLKKNGKIITFVPNKFSYWLFIKPFIMKEIKEFRFNLARLINLHKRVGLEVLECGGFSVFPFKFSPEFLGKYVGRIIYVVCKKV